MRRFFFDTPHGADGLVSLSREESHHVARVLRLTTGDCVELLDGQGSVFLAEITSAEKIVTLKIIEQLATPVGTDKQVWVCQGDLKGKKMDVIVQKCTELGVARFVGFSSSRSQGRTPENRLERKYERWQKLVTSACKQSNRIKLMDFEEKPFESLLQSKLFKGVDLKIIFWEEERQITLGDIDWQKGYKTVCLMLGPEGGFSTNEIDLAQAAGWKCVSLGKQILRAETATLAAVSIVQHRLGNM